MPKFGRKLSEIGESSSTRKFGNLNYRSRDPKIIIETQTLLEDLFRMRNSRFMVRVRSCVDDHVLRWTTQKEARLMCGEDRFGNSLADVEAVAIRLSRKKELLKDIRLRQPERAHDSSPCSISSRETWLNAMVESGMALRSTDTIAEMDGITAKIRLRAEASENNRSVTVVPGKVIGLTECAV